jgi:hypothetical protein
MTATARAPRPERRGSRSVSGAASSGSRVVATLGFLAVVASACSRYRPTIARVAGIAMWWVARACGSHGSFGYVAVLGLGAATWAHDRLVRATSRTLSLISVRAASQASLRTTAPIARPPAVERPRSRTSEPRQRRCSARAAVVRPDRFARNLVDLLLASDHVRNAGRSARHYLRGKRLPPPVEGVPC